MCAKTTPEVPRVHETSPGSTMPLPIALAAWSPAPATTGVPARSPVAAAPAGETLPATQLTGESNAPDVRARRPRLGQDTANRLLSRVPPVLGALLGPEGALHAHLFVRRGRSVLHLAALVYQQRARPTGAHIDPQPV